MTRVSAEIRLYSGIQATIANESYSKPTSRWFYLVVMASIEFAHLFSYNLTMLYEVPNAE